MGKGKEITKMPSDEDLEKLEITFVHEHKYTSDAEKLRAERKENLAKKKNDKLKAIFKNEFYSNGKWSIKKVEKNFKNYTEALIAFSEIYSSELSLTNPYQKQKGTKQIRDFVGLINRRAFGYSTIDLPSLARNMALLKLSKIDLIDDSKEKKKKMLKEMMLFKRKYLAISDKEFIDIIVNIIDLKLTSSTIKQYLKEPKNPKNSIKDKKKK